MTIRSGSKRAARVACAMLLLATALITLPFSQSAAQVSGTTYSSPNYGYTVIWQLPWYVTESATDDDGFDVLGLADSQSSVYFSGGRTGGDPDELLAQYADQLANDPGVSGFAQVDDPQCAAGGNGTSIVASCYRFDLVGEDGALRPIGLMLKAWDMGDGIELLLEAYTEEPLLSSFVPHWHAFGVYPPGQMAPTPAANTCQTETIHNVSYCMDPALTERDRGEIVEGVRLGQETIVAYFGNPDLGNIQVTGLQGVSASGEGLMATARGRSIAVYAGSRAWLNNSPVESIAVLVHEFFHIYQDVMTEGNDSPVPLWFTEGSATAVAYMASSQIGVTDQSEFYDLTAYSLTENPFIGTLDDLYAANSMSEAGAYPLAYLAVQYLLGSRGMSVAAIGDVYTRMRAGASFDDAFTQVFGLTPDQFSIEFETWRPSFQQVNELPDDFYPSTGQAAASPVTLQVVPASVGRDQQAIVTASTGPLAACGASLQLGSGTIERETVANGEGNVFWLFSIPPDAVVGPANLTVDCGAGPVSAPLTIS